jgi:hypothetical protein
MILHKKQGEVRYSNYLKKNNNTWALIKIIAQSKENNNTT